MNRSALICEGWHPPQNHTKHFPAGWWRFSSSSHEQPCPRIHILMLIGSIIQLLEAQRWCDVTFWRRGNGISFPCKFLIRSRFLENLSTSKWQALERIWKICFLSGSQKYIEPQTQNHLELRSLFHPLTTCQNYRRCSLLPETHVAHCQHHWRVQLPANAHPQDASIESKGPK